MKNNVPLLAAALLFAAHAALAEPDAAAPSRPADNPLEGRIKIELRQADPAQVFQSFGKLAGLQVVVDPAIHRKLSIGLDNVRLKTALDAACDSLDCRWELQEGHPGRLIVTALPASDAKPSVPTQPRDTITVRVTNADLPDLL
ncbi:MAG TPA: hypothetical protein VMM92_01980, partial [Thermoanaerobaculia bacterium]|nr:hypothetical protein [Thermoanaerobaculia bacterium]